LLPVLSKLSHVPSEEIHRFEHEEGTASLIPTSEAHIRFDSFRYLVYPMDMKNLIISSGSIQK
jgi:hypothetical protein